MTGDIKISTGTRGTRNASRPHRFFGIHDAQQLIQHKPQVRLHGFFIVLREIPNTVRTSVQSSSDHIDSIELSAGVDVLASSLPPSSTRLSNGDDSVTGGVGAVGDRILLPSF